MLGLRWLLKLEFALFTLVLGTYAYFYQAGGWNQNSRFDLTRAIVEQGTLLIDRYAYNTGDLSCRGPLGRCQQARADMGEHYYSDKAPGASWLAVPAYAIAHATFGCGQPSLNFLAMSAWWVTITAVGVPSAIAVVMLYRLLEAFTQSECVRITVTLAYSFSTLAFPYATLFYGHQLAAALLLIGFALLVRAKHLGAKPPTASFLVVCGIVLGYAVVVEYPSLMAVVLLVGYAAIFIRPHQRLVWLVTGGTMAAMALVVYHWLAFGGPLTLPYHFSTQQPRHVGFMGIAWPARDVLREILFGAYRGLFYSAPWLLLALPGSITLLGRRGRRLEALVCVAIVILFVWLNGALVDWQGGWAMGPRYLIPAIPFLAVLVVGVMARWHPYGAASRVLTLGGTALTAVLVVVSAMLMLAGTAVRPEVPMNILQPFSEYLLPLFYRGELAVNTQSIEDLWPPVGGTRQAWNVGQLVGFDGLASLVPLGLYVAATAAWLVWAARQHTHRTADSGCKD